MHYPVVVFGVKDTSEDIITYIHRELMPVDLVVTVAPAVTEKNDIAGYRGLSHLTQTLGIPVFSAEAYDLRDETSQRFFRDNTFGIGIVSGWQRLIPGSVLAVFAQGIFGFHGNAGYLPFGRGRSPLNWSIILGDTRFHLNLFQYDEAADSPNVFATETFQLTPHDNIRTAQYKNTLAQKTLLRALFAHVRAGEEIPIRRSSKDFDSWYEKRGPQDGRIDFHDRTRHIYDLIRGVSAPFPGAFCYVGEEKVVVWEAHPFDEYLDFSAYAPGEVIAVFDGKPIVRTVDGSLLIDRYEAAISLTEGMLLC